MSKTAPLTQAPAEGSRKQKFSFGMFLVAIGVVYGDIGTSPLYVIKSIVEGNGGMGAIDTDFIIGALSLIIWTVTLLTTIKYVVIAMKADNNGEGGIFSLYSLVRKCGKWLIVPAMVGGAALLADGMLTPAVTVTTAVEGLRSIPLMDRLLGSGQGVVIVIVLTIICVLFAIQHAGTSRIGKAFGPVMLVWFSFLAFGGLYNLFRAPIVLKAFNPIYAIRILFSPNNKLGFMILGSIFLAATGAEALYSDMGHVGRENIYFSWPFVKICLILNYFGQGAWVILNRGNPALLAETEVNPFYMMLPGMLRPVAVLLSAAAAVIASQALITGSYTLVAEAIRLDLMPHLQTRYPSETKGQIYISVVNTILWLGCSAVVLYFRSGSRIESAYGLAITITMLMTTLLLSIYLWKIRGKPLIALPVFVVFGTIEAIFFVSSLSKFASGGYITVLLALAILFVMVIWHRGSSIEDSCRFQLNMADYIENIRALRDDSSLPYVADNLIYLEKPGDRKRMDRDILYSILDKDPKRAKAYWFFSVCVTDDPYTANYEVDTCGTDFIFRVRLNLGFRMRQSVNVYMRQIIRDLRASGELPSQHRIHSIYGASDIGTFKFCNIVKKLPQTGDIGGFDSFVLNAKYAIRAMIGSTARWFGMDAYSQITESVPMFLPAYGSMPQQLDRMTADDFPDD